MISELSEMFELTQTFASGLAFLASGPDLVKLLILLLIVCTISAGSYIVFERITSRANGRNFTIRRSPLLLSLRIGATVTLFTFAVYDGATKADKALSIIGLVAIWVTHYTSSPKRRKNPIRDLNIFVSYRRSDSGQVVPRIVEVLRGNMKGGQLFLDFEAIQTMDDFEKAISETIVKTDVLLAIIGPNWAPPTEWVRYELESALSNGVPIFPILVDGAKPPDELPDGIAQLRRIQGQKLDIFADFHYHMSLVTHSLSDMSLQSRTKGSTPTADRGG